MSKITHFVKKSYKQNLHFTFIKVFFKYYAVDTMF